MTSSRVFVFYLKVRSTNLVTQNRIVQWNKEKNHRTNGRSRNNGGSYRGDARPWSFQVKYS